MAFGFMVSTRMGEGLRQMLERGGRVLLRAQCKTTYYPTRNEIVWALIRGREKPEEELIFTAHLYEGMAKQGANDNVSGSVSILETAWVITKLIQEVKNIVHQAYLREEAALKSVLFFSLDDQKLSAHIKESCESLKVRQKISLNALLSYYRNVTACHGVRPISPQLTPEEQRLSRLVPKRSDKLSGYFNNCTFAKSIEDKKVPVYDLGKYEDFEICNFIDGKRSILEIRNAVSAEFRSIPLIDVENYIEVLEIGGMETIEERI